MDLQQWIKAIRQTGAASDIDESHLRDAAWVARCVGRGDVAPLGPADVAALADTLRPVDIDPEQPLFYGGDGQEPGVWIIRSGLVELSVPSRQRRTVVGVLRPGDVEGDIPLMLDMAPPYAARAIEDVACLHLNRTDFEALLTRHPAIARRWLSSVAQRLAVSHERLIALLGRPLPNQLAGLLLDEADNAVVQLPQRTLAAMLGAARPSLNKVLKNFERQGYVDVGYSSVTILDPEALGRLRSGRPTRSN